MVPLAIVPSGPFAAQPTLFYNSLLPATSEFGFGWSNIYKQNIATSGGAQAVFDSANQKTVRIDARGNRVSQVHDNAGQMLGVHYPDGTRVTQTFDAVGNRTVLADATGQYQTLIDALNRDRAVTTPANLTMSMAFDGLRRRWAPPLSDRAQRRTVQLQLRPGR